MGVCTMVNHSTHVRTRFSRQYFRLCFVKILVNPKGLTAVLPRRDKNPAPENSPTQKTRIAVQFWTQSAKQGWRLARAISWKVPAGHAFWACSYAFAMVKNRRIGKRHVRKTLAFFLSDGDFPVFLRLSNISLIVFTPSQVFAFRYAEVKRSPF